MREIKLSKAAQAKVRDGTYKLVKDDGSVEWYKVITTFYPKLKYRAHRCSAPYDKDVYVAEEFSVLSSSDFDKFTPWL